MDKTTVEVKEELTKLKYELARKKRAVIAFVILIFLLCWAVFVTVAFDAYKETKDYKALHQYSLKDFNPVLYETENGLVLGFSGDKAINDFQIAVSVWLLTPDSDVKIAYRFLLVRNVDLQEGVQFFVQPPMTYEGKIKTVGVDITLFYDGKPFEFPPTTLQTYEVKNAP